MQQIYKFEAKLASGNAEQCLSRDVYRLAHRLDLTRAFSFYYAGPGFYFNNAATVFAMFFFLYLQLLSHLLQVALPGIDSFSRSLPPPARPPGAGMLQW
jgi:callose synthase